MQARIAQAVRIVASALAAVETDPAQALRALNAQAAELRSAGTAIGDSVLATAARQLQVYLAEVTNDTPLSEAGLRPHADRLLAYLPEEGRAARSAA